MNAPPKSFQRVSHEHLHRFTSDAAQKVGLPEPRAELLARLLSTNDLRGVFSHGTQQIAAYARLMRDGNLNRDPQVNVVRETPTSLQLDGDGGLGYFPSYDGTLRVIEKAKESGVAVLSTGNHGHFGSAGIYARLPLEHDLLTFVTSGHQIRLAEGRPYVTAAGGSPMAFSSPTNEEDPLVVDFGAIHDFYEHEPYRKAIERLAPAVVFRGVGLGGICQSWGGFLAGVPYGEAPADRKWAGANQGSLVVVFRIDLFMDADEFKRNMDAYIQDARKLEPVDGFDESLFPGGIEAKRERMWRDEGVPFGDWHRKRLEDLANELELTPPWK